jgi:membrane protease subunit HflC
MNKLRIGSAIIVILLGITGLSAVYTVNERETAVILEFGKFVHQEEQPGIHFKWPFIQKARYFDKRVLDLDIPPDEIPTRDQEQIIVDAFVRYRINDAQTFYEANRGGATDIFESRRLTASVNGAVRAEFGKMNLESLLGFAIGTSSALTKGKRKTLSRTDREKTRDELTKRITDRVRKEVEKRYGVKVVDVRIKRLDLPAGNKKSILGRMAEQRRQEATRIRAEGEARARKIKADADRNARVTIAKAKKQAEILRGLGEAKAQEIYNTAYGKDPEFFQFWVSMNAYKIGLQGENTRLLMSPNIDFFRYFKDMHGKASAPAKK